MVEGVFCASIELQLREVELQRQRAFQNTSGERGVYSHMPSRFMAVFSFIAFLASSSSLLKDFIIWSLPCINCSNVQRYPCPYYSQGYQLHCHVSCSCIVGGKCCYLQDVHDASSPHFVSLALAYQRLTPEFAWPLPSDPGVLSQLNPSIVRNFVGRDTVT